MYYTYIGRAQCRSGHPEPEFFKDPRHRFHGIDFLWEINSNVELIFGNLRFYVKDLKRSENCHRHMLSVGEGFPGHPYWSKHSWQAYNLAAVSRGRKVDSCFRNILWDIADSIPYLVHTQFQESISPPLPVQKYRLSSIFEQYELRTEPQLNFR